MQLKILSWNIWGGKNIEEVISYLRNYNADIIALQEIIRDAEGNTALTIARALGYECVFDLGMKLSSKWSGPPREKEEIIDFGNAILSKHKIIASETLVLSESELRTATNADIRVGNSVLHIYSVHLKHCHVRNNKPENALLQKEQIEKLLQVLPREKVVVLGDFNGVPETYPVKKIAKILQDAEASSATPTWSVYPEGCDICSPASVEFKFDYIFSSLDLRPKSFKVGDSRASDHLPVSALIEI